MLAYGSDPKLSAVAVKELAHPTDVEEQLKLADEWWDIAQADAANKRLLELRHPMEQDRFATAKRIGEGADRKAASRYTGES